MADMSADQKDHEKVLDSGNQPAVLSDTSSADYWADAKVGYWVAYSVCFWVVEMAAVLVSSLVACWVVLMVVWKVDSMDF